eukprot:TRINITY_DN10220_c0_g1_i2.p1 TRINITY_DN10220_c0_g1~~TRINITY_DN10220_c0_g1_i2.p1  ORF type:complete len:319 (+),score=82.00 TRINITY_DN10220_c0_g1_i2:110-1066(+)
MSYIDVRKLAGKLICELAYKNSEVQDFICNCFDITPVQERVAINKVPYRVQRMIVENPKCTEFKEDLSVGEKYWCFPSFSGGEEFPDPLEYLIGFTLVKEQIATENNSELVASKESKAAPSDNIVRNKKCNNLLQKDALNSLAVRNNSKKIAGTSNEIASKFSAFSATKQNHSRIHQNFFRPETNIISKKFEAGNKKFKLKSAAKKHKHNSMRNKMREKDITRTHRGTENHKANPFPTKRSLKLIKLQTSKDPLKLGKNKSSRLKTVMAIEQEQVKAAMQRSAFEDAPSFDLYKRNSKGYGKDRRDTCLLYTSPSPRD